MKSIPINNTDYFATVDDEDYERLIKSKWYICGNGPTIYKTENYKSTRMANTILGIDDVIIDHKDRNPFNNQRVNLRKADYSLNAANRAKRMDIVFTSKHKGVHKGRTKSRVTWIAAIKIRQRTIYLGTFDLEIDAAKAYNEAAIKYFGEFAVLNII